MRKLATLIMTVCMTLAFALGLTACGNKPCEHTYDNACDTVCNLCEETRTITHTPNEDDGNCLTAIT